MATTVKTTGSKPKKNLSKKSYDKDNEIIHALLKNTEHQARRSALLLENGVLDSLSTYFSQLLSNPIPRIVEDYKHSENSLLFLIHTSVVIALSIFAEKIEAVYRVSEKDFYYFIVLKEDTTAIRALIYKIIDWYERENYLNIDVERFPLHFHFVPQSLAAELNGYEKILL